MVFMFHGGFFGGHGFGPGFGGSGFGGGFGAGRKGVIATAALLLDGPADSGQIVQLVSDATDGAFTPPEEAVKAAIGVLAARGLVTVDDGLATLTEFGENVLSWRGISSENAHRWLAKAAKFGDAIKIRNELFEIGGLARTIVFSGTDEQKERLDEAKAKVLGAVTEAKKSLYSALAST
jgi:hypothetical protein